MNISEYILEVLAREHVRRDERLAGWSLERPHIEGNSDAVSEGAPRTENTFYTSVAIRFRAYRYLMPFDPISTDYQPREVRQVTVYFGHNGPAIVIGGIEREA